MTPEEELAYAAGRLAALDDAIADLRGKRRHEFAFAIFVLQDLRKEAQSDRDRAKWAVQFRRHAS